MRNTLAALVIASALPIAAALQPPPLGTAHAAAPGAADPRFDGAPAFDGGLPAGAVEIARHPVRWADRDPGRVAAGRSSDWPVEIERILVARMATVDLPRFTEGGPADARVGEPWPDCVAGFRAVLPGDVEVYAVEHPTAHPPLRDLRILLRRPSTGVVGEVGGCFSLRWIEVGPGGPPADWADLDGDGSMEIGFRFHHHNGTADDGDFMRWYRVGADLELELVHVSPLWDWVSVVSRGEQGRITYRLLRGPDGALRDEGWFDNPAYGVGPVRVEGDPPDRAHMRPFQRGR